MTSQKFGGDWTAKKLNIFTSYLDAYLIALQNQKFKKIYIDAFAGTGEIETSDGEAYLAGSAKRALSAERRFDHYYFIESDESKASELEHMIDTEFPHLKGSRQSIAVMQMKNSVRLSMTLTGVLAGDFCS